MFMSWGLCVYVALHESTQIDGTSEGKKCVSRKGAKAQRKLLGTRQRFAPLRLCGRNLLLIHTFVQSGSMSCLKLVNLARLSKHFIYFTDVELFLRDHPARIVFKQHRAVAYEFK